MRADSYFWIPGTAGRLALVLLVPLLLLGCKTESDSEDPAIIGVPPEDAYLGVEYSYNFGAVDKDSILNYSLTNAPSWLAMEDTTNKARQGIIIRGVPGVTGGERGRDDLGRTSRINLVGNDQATLGAQPFSVDVQENQLSVVSRDYSEARPEEDEDEDEENDGEEEEEKPDFQCDPPFIGARGEHSYSINVYDDAGNVVDTEAKTSETQPVLVQVNLDQPSVTTIDVAFELRSSYNPARCDNGFTPPHQRCDTGLANADEATIGPDVVALGNGSGASLPIPDYVQYQQDEEGLFTKGVLTLPPGITECFVRIEVVDDLEPEDLEAFSFALTEVRSGIAGLGSSNGGVSEPLRIEDDEPLVSLETQRGGARDVVNLGSVTEYNAVINGKRDQPYFAKIGSQEGSDAILGSDFDLEYRNPAYDEVENPSVPEWLAGDLLEFPVGVKEVRFRVLVEDSADYSNPAPNDRFVLLGLDQSYQSGRSNHAASDSDDELRISFNEKSTPLMVGDDSGFVPSDMAIGQDGRVFISGHDVSAGNIPQVRVFSQKGVEVSRVDLFPRGISLEAPPVIAFNARDIEAGSEDVLRNEFAVSFGIEEDEAGNSTPGNVNLVTQRWFFDTALSPSDYAQDWQLFTGTDENDFPRWVGLAPTTGDVLVAGETTGLVEPSDEPNENFGSFIQRIDTQEDGPLLVPNVAWQRKVESISHDERVVGGGIQNTFPIVVGDSSGAVEGESQFGGKDAFFFTAENAGNNIDVQQAGTADDESLVDGFFELGTVWLIGNSNSDYRVTTEQGVKVLRRDATDSAAGFLLGYTPAGSAMEAYLINDVDDLSSENLRAATTFDNDLIAAGATNGELSGYQGASANTLEDPALFRRNRQPRFEEDEDDDEENDDAEDKTLIEEPSQQWARQIPVMDPSTGIVELLVNYRDDEITALTRIDSSTGTVYRLDLFNAEGDHLNDSP